DTVLLDGGTTTWEVARSLVGRRIQVVTNSLPIAQLLASSQQTDLILIGGYVYPRTGVALGPLAIATMQSLRVRTAILRARRDWPRGDLQLELTPGRDRATDDVVRAGGDDRRRPYEVRATGAGPALRAGGDRFRGGRFGPEPRAPRSAGGGRGGDPRRPGGG